MVVSWTGMYSSPKLAPSGKCTAGLLGAAGGLLGELHGLLHALAVRGRCFHGALGVVEGATGLLLPNDVAEHREGFGQVRAVVSGEHAGATLAVGGEALVRGNGARERI